MKDIISPFVSHKKITSKSPAAHLDKSLKIHSKDLGNGKFEVCGVIFYCSTHIEGIHKYLRTKKESES